MTVTTTSLTRAAGLSAAVAGLIFCTVQINHPPMEVASSPPPSGSSAMARSSSWPCWHSPGSPGCTCGRSGRSGFSG